MTSIVDRACELAVLCKGGSHTPHAHVSKLWLPVKTARDPGFALLQHAAASGGCLQGS